MATQDLDAVGERSDFPIVCETCLGPNPYVRMQRYEHGGACHISGRPYTVFRWRPGSDARYKKTIICQEVAKAKNVCQVCLLDLDYNLPVQVRDAALGMADDEGLPGSDVGKEFQLQKMTDDGTLGEAFKNQRPNEMLERLQRSTPYYKRNKAKICSFFVKGECKRGAECPFRHEMPLDNGLQDQNIKDRYYGVNDPVAKKLMDRADKLAKLTPPEDQSICTLYVGGLPGHATEEDIRDRFYTFGEVVSVRIQPRRASAFVTFDTRASAERAAEELGSSITIGGQRCRMLWGRPQEKPADGAGAAASPSGAAGGAAAYYGMVPPQLQRGQAGYAAGPDLSGGGAYYPAMDTTQLGSVMPDPKRGTAMAGDGGPAAKRTRGPGGQPHHMQQQQQRPPMMQQQPPHMQQPHFMPYPGYGLPPQPHPGYGGYGPPQPMMMMPPLARPPPMMGPPMGGPPPTMQPPPQRPPIAMQLPPMQQPPQQPPPVPQPPPAAAGAK